MRARLEESEKRRQREENEAEQIKEALLEREAELLGSKTASEKEIAGFLREIGELRGDLALEEEEREKLSGKIRHM